MNVKDTFTIDTPYDLAGQLHRQVGTLLAARVLDAEGDALSSLRAAIDIQTQAAALLASAVDYARESGVTWQEIGDALGVTRQAAFQRFGKPVDPRTGAIMNTTPLPDAAELASLVIDELVAARWDDVAARFDDAMRARLDSQGLAAAWAQIVASVGAFESHVDPTVARAADVTATSTVLTFEAGELVARIAFRDDRSIAGLFILPPEK